MLADNYGGPNRTGVTSATGRRLFDVGQGRPGILRKLVKGAAKKFSDASTYQKGEDLITKKS